MLISLKNKHTLQIDNFYFNCSIGKKGTIKKKIEGDLKTPVGTFSLEHLYYRKDRVNKPETKLKCIHIQKYMGWCNDINNPKKYNRLITINNKVSHEKLFRKDHKYDLLIPIKYNFKKKIVGKGSCIFLHLTRNYAPTAGCIALSEKDFLILLKLINKNSKIKIN
jgi:L,D-peptidoglycan transpeptidase YkuD (ErfK/YbiS/YcfS/YnhG family)